MSYYSTKIRQYWFPFAILLIIVIAAGWIIVGVINPTNVQGNIQQIPTANPPTATDLPTLEASPTATLTSTTTPTARAATATPSSNCTYTIFYWSSNPEIWMIENLLLGNLSYSKNQAIEIMTLSDPSPSERLMGQFFTTILNTLKGSDPEEINTVLIDTRDRLILRPHGIDLSPAELEEIESYTEALTAYNAGLIGPGQCPDEPATPTPATTDTPTPTATFKPAPDQPFFTATPTRSSGGGDKPKPPATQAPLPTQPPPPTNTSPPPPTSPPLATPTQVKPPTPAPTKPPPTEAPPPGP